MKQISEDSERRRKEGSLARDLGAQGITWQVLFSLMPPIHPILGTGEFHKLERTVSTDKIQKQTNKTK